MHIQTHPPRKCADCGAAVVRSQRWPTSETTGIVLCLNCYPARLFAEQIAAAAWASVFVREFGLALDGIVPLRKITGSPL
jgi:hypothetical protein